MAKILIGIVAVIACFYLAESLDCNKCTLSMFGYCLGSATETCTTNTSVCYTSKATFPSLPSFNGLIKQGCTDGCNCMISTTTNTTTNATIAATSSTVTSNGTLGYGMCGFTYVVTTQCCTTDKCNPVDLSGATINTMSLSVALSVAALAAMWGSYM